MRNVMRLVMWVPVILLLSWSPAADAADCPVQIRLWVDGGDAWFDYGETVVVPTTEPRPRLGVYVKTGRHPLATTAEWGYPKDFGFNSARPAEVAGDDDLIGVVEHHQLVVEPVLGGRRGEPLVEFGGGHRRGSGGDSWNTDHGSSL